jgi:hypothetical protein
MAARTSGRSYRLILLKTANRSGSGCSLPSVCAAELVFFCTRGMLRVCGN